MTQHRFVITALVVLFSCGTTAPVLAQGEKNQVQRSGKAEEQHPPQLHIQQQKAPEAAGELYRYQNQRQASPQQPQRIQEQQRTDAAGQHAVRIQNRFSYYADRLDEVAAKLQTLIEAMAKAGVRVEAANNTLIEAQVEIRQGRKLGEEASEAYWSIGVSDYAEQQQKASESIQAATQARVSYQKAVQLLKRVLLELR
jgi:hypothetical protein